MYLTAACPYCRSAERLLAEKDVRDELYALERAGGLDPLLENP